MFKKFVAIAFAALVAASVVTGCGNNAGNTTSVASSKDSRLKPKYPFKNFLVHDKDKKEEGYAGSFDLYTALQKYGATDIRMIEKDLGEEDNYASVIYAVSFSNGATMFINFNNGNEDMYVLNLLSVRIFRTEQGYIPNYYDDFQKNTNYSKWERSLLVASPEEMQMGTDYDEAHNRDDKKNWLTFSTGNLTGDSDLENRTFRVNSYFDKVFNSSIAPYLQLEDIPWDEDPFFNNPNVLGESRNYASLRDAYNK